MTTPHEREREARESVVRPQPNHKRADAYAQELCIDAMHDGTLKGNLAAAYLALKQENLDLWTELEMARFIIKVHLASEARSKVEVAVMTNDDAVPEMPTTGDTYLRRVWWAVRDKDGCDAEYDTAHHAIDAYHNWWNVEWSQFAPYRVIRCEVHETEVDPIWMEEP